MYFLSIWCFLILSLSLLSAFFAVEHLPDLHLHFFFFLFMNFGVQPIKLLWGENPLHGIFARGFYSVALVCKSMHTSWLVHNHNTSVSRRHLRITCMRYAAGKVSAVMYPVPDIRRVTTEMRGIVTCTYVWMQVSSKVLVVWTGKKALYPSLQWTGISNMTVLD